MKKRVKLLTTIASLCLAVALMAFGVYAATSVSFSTTSQISFAAQEIEGIWSLQISNADYTGKYKTPQVVLDSDASKTGDNGEDVTPDTTFDGDTYVAVDTDDTAVAIVTLSEGKAEITYTVKFENTGDGLATVKLEYGLSDNAVGYTVKSASLTRSVTTTDNTDEYVSGNETKDLAKNETAIFVVVVELNTKATGFNAAINSEDTLSLTATATKKA